MGDFEVAAGDLADKGRTRILDYPLPADPGLIIELAAEILNFGYGMFERDELLFSNE